MHGKRSRGARERGEKREESPRFKVFFSLSERRVLGLPLGRGVHVGAHLRGDVRGCGDRNVISLLIMDLQSVQV